MKFECPKCQSHLKYWEGYEFVKERLVSKSTGQLDQKVTKAKEFSLGTHGLICTNSNCNFEYEGYYSWNDENYDHLADLLESLADKRK